MEEMAKELVERLQQTPAAVVVVVARAATQAAQVVQES